MLGCIKIFARIKITVPPGAHSKNSKKYILIEIFWEFHQFYAPKISSYLEAHSIHRNP